jgi:hypothetical protein
MIIVQRPCSSVDRALASEARCGSSSLPRDAVLIKTLILFLVIIILLPSCVPERIVPPAPWQDWVIDDVLWLSPGTANQNGLIAAYFRKAESSCQFRFDLLNYSSTSIFDLQISLFSQIPLSHILNLPDYTLILPSNSEAFLLVGTDPSKYSRGIQVFRNPSLDGIVLQLVNQELCGAPNFYLQAELKMTDGSILDSTPLISSNASAPTPAYLLLAFWDTLPASTPLQLLRRWDGAHTGPFGQRHGLKNLAGAAEKYQVPVFLLDLKQPNSLAGLELLNQTNWIRRLQQSNIFILPDSTWGSMLAKTYTLDLAQQVTKNYNLQSSQLVFSPDGSSSPAHAGYFSFTQNPAPVFSNSASRIFPLPYPPDQPPPEWITQAATSDGLSEYTLRALLSNASQVEENNLLILGGNLPTSPLADKSIAEPVMSYISAHPWIHAISSVDLMSLPAKSLNNTSSNITSPPSRVEEAVFLALQASPTNELSASAWEMFLNLTNVTIQDPTYSIQQRYLPQIYNLLKASNWVDQPEERVDCSLDLDDDGFYECILSNSSIFLILDPLGGRLEFAVGCKSPGSCSQIIGTTAQLSAGLSDPTLWNISHPYNPDLIPGALDDPNSVPLLYAIVQAPGSISFSNPENETTKIYTLLPDGFQIQVKSINPQTFTIPLIFEPNNRNKPSGEVQYGFEQISSTSFSWRILDESYLDINISGAEYHFSSFIQSISTIREPENPDLAYSNFFFKPFPLATIQVEPSKNWMARFTLR